MKRKQNASKHRNKLTLNKQTIRELKPVDLEQSAGAGNYDELQPGDSDTCPC
jgi:hypothetical protein